MIFSDKNDNSFCKFDKNEIAGKTKSNVDNYVETVDFSDKPVQKFSTKKYVRLGKTGRNIAKCHKRVE